MTIGPEPEAPTMAPVCVVSTTSALSVGGLATYVRCLSRELARERPITAVARFAEQHPRALDYAAVDSPRTLDHGGGVLLHIVAPPRVLRPLAAAARRLIHVRRLQRLAIALFVIAFARPVARAIPRGSGVVHWVGTGWELLGFAALRAARRRSTAFTMLPAIHPGSWGVGTVDARLYAAADYVFALSRFERRVLVELGVAEARIGVTGVGPGVGGNGDGQRFRTRFALGERPIVLFMGRKQRYKGYHALREAVQLVSRDIPGVLLVAIGGSEELPRFELPPELVLDLGEAEDPHVADALAACDVLCVPSTGESFGIVYIEAWQYAKPVIVGPAPASRELVEHGVTGLHVEQTPEDIARAVRRVLGDPVAARAMGAAGQSLQRERFTWSAVRAVHASVFGRLTSPERSAGRDG